MADYVDVQIRLPLADGKLRELFRRRGTITKEKYTEAGVEINGKISRRLAGAFRPYALHR